MIEAIIMLLIYVCIFWLVFGLLVLLWVVRIFLSGGGVSLPSVG